VAPALEVDGAYALMVGTQDKQPGLRYVAVADEIVERIAVGTYGIGDRLPSQQQLARELGVSLTTLRSAVELLQERGHLRSDHGLGTFVTEPRANQPTALAIDDDPAAVHFLREVLQAEGIKVTGASSARQAADLVAAQPFDVIFLDLVMPGGSGVDTLAAFHRMGIETPVVLITGAADTDLIDSAMDYGPLTLIRKPLQLAQLRAALQNLRLIERVASERRPV
jgi:CheY-like chemotaxis protein